MVLEQLLSPRKLVIDGIVERLRIKRVVLVRGTPASGKTALRRLLTSALRRLYPNGNIVVIENGFQNMEERDGDSTLEMKEKALTKRLNDALGFTITEEMPPVPTYLLIDEAQTTYHYISFWNDIMKPVIDGAAGKIYVCLFSSYGSACGSVVDFRSRLLTPPIISSTSRVEMEWKITSADFSTIGILLQEEEAIDVLSRRCRDHDDSPIFDDELCRSLAAYSGGHAGVLVGLFQSVMEKKAIKDLKRKGRTYVITYEDFRSTFFTDPVASSLQGSLFGQSFMRGLPSTDRLKEDVVLAHVMSSILGGGDATPRELIETAAGKFPEEEVHLALNCCTKEGWLHKTIRNNTSATEVFVFPSSLHAWYYQCLFSTLPPKQEYVDIEKFAIDLISAFRASVLRQPPRRMACNSGNIGGTPVEDVFCYEFYRAAFEILYGDWLWSPQFGRRGVKDSGCVDFYVGHSRWAFEFLRNGRKSTIEEHYARFTRGGKYHGWVEDELIKDYRVIDFRMTKPPSGIDSFEKLLYVVFDHQFHHVSFFNGRGEQIGSPKRLLEKTKV